MKYICKKTLITILFISAAANAYVKKLPPLETIISEPIQFENIDLWVIADIQGPIINRACQANHNCNAKIQLQSNATHNKTEKCPDYLALQLAKYSWNYHRNDIPFTIVDNWRLTSENVLCQFDSADYDLQARGGSWQICNEALKKQTSAVLALQWLNIKDDQTFQLQQNTEKTKTEIQIATFSEMRTRDEYPKQRKF